MPPDSSCKSMEQLADTIPTHRKILLVPRPVDNNGLAFDILIRDIAPEPAVIAVVAIIPHHEIGMRRHGYGTEVIARLLLAGQDHGILEYGVFDDQWFPVNIHFLVFDQDSVARKADDPFDKILIRIDGVLEDDHIFAVNIFNGDEHFSCKRISNAINKFINQDMIADEQGRYHGPRGDLKGLNDKSPDKQSKDKRNGNCFYIFADYGFRLTGFNSGSF